MPGSLTKGCPREFSRRFVSVVIWLGIGLITTSLLWIFVMVFVQALEQLCKK